MSREEMRKALFNVVEQLTEHKLTVSGKTLLLAYFNDSSSTGSFKRALDAIEKYYPESIPAPEERSERLKVLIEKLEKAARKWDAESIEE